MDLGSLIHIAAFTEPFNKTASRSQMTVAFATLSHSTCGIPCFLSIPEDPRSPITFFFSFSSHHSRDLCFPFATREDETELPTGFVTGGPQPAGGLLVIDTGHSVRTFNNSARCPHSALNVRGKQSGLELDLQ